jgi:hypothetical protein
VTREKGYTILGKRARRMVAAATAVTFLGQNFAWAVCADGMTFPPGGFVAGQPPAVNWSPNTFTGLSAEHILRPVLLRRHAGGAEAAPLNRFCVKRDDRRLRLGRCLLPLSVLPMLS